MSKEFWHEEARRFLFGAGGSNAFTVSTCEWLGERLRLASAWERRIGRDPTDVSSLSFTAKKREKPKEPNPDCLMSFEKSKKVIEKYE